MTLHLQDEVRITRPTGNIFLTNIHRVYVGDDIPPSPDDEDSEVTHTTILDTAGVADYRSVIGYFAQTIMKDLRLVSGYDVLYGKVKAFVREELFDHPVKLEDPNTLRNLSELAATKTLLETFKKGMRKSATVSN